MIEIKSSIEVRVPLPVAYARWMQFESFPRFMEGVRTVRALDDRHLLWQVEMAGFQRDWVAEVVEEVADERIAWVSVDGGYHEGDVSFYPINGNGTRIEVRIDWEPEGFLETAAGMLGLVSSRIKGNLHQFKEFIELKGADLNVWAGAAR
jgi:uncharacterized membrane protein